MMATPRINCAKMENDLDELLLGSKQKTDGSSVTPQEVLRLSMFCLQCFDTVGWAA